MLKLLILGQAKHENCTEFFRDLNKDPSVHGIIVQMPLDSEQEVETLFGKNHNCANTTQQLR